jgi:hypothetical protein
MEINLTRVTSKAVSVQFSLPESLLQRVVCNKRATLDALCGLYAGCYTRTWKPGRTAIVLDAGYFPWYSRAA